MNTSLHVPITLWGREVLSHPISCITVFPNPRTIITGTFEGHLGIWDLRCSAQGLARIVPRNIIFAHNTAVLDLSRATNDRPNVVSLSDNGELCLWDVDDGTCLQSNVIPGNHSNLYSAGVCRGSIKEWRVILYGHYPEINVVDPISLECLYSLCTRFSPDWITALCVFKPPKKQDEVVLALTMTGSLKIWALHLAVEKNSNEPLYEQEFKTLDCGRAKAVCINTFTQRTLMIVTAKVLLIYDTTDFNFLSSMPNHRQAWVGGDFITADRIVCWDKIGRVYLYKLPSRYLLGSEGIFEVPSEKAIRAPMLLCQFEPYSSRASFNPVTFFSHSRKGPLNKLLVQACLSGSVTVWQVSDSEDSDILLMKHAGNVLAEKDGLCDMEVTYVEEGLKQSSRISRIPLNKTLPLTSVSLSGLWNTHKPAGLVDSLGGDHEHTIPITATLYLPSYGYIALGRADGNIIITPVVKAAMAQLLQGNVKHKTDNLKYCVLSMHEGRVSSLLYPCDENPRYDPRLFVSGGADFTVRLWDVFARTLIHVFPCHGGEALKLLVTPADCSLRLSYAIVSVAQDHSVCILSLKERRVLLLAGRHTYPVQTIRWKCKEDYMIIGCVDNTVFVWQVETGHLDRCIAGSAAVQVLDSCDDDGVDTLPVTLHGRKIGRGFHVISDLQNQTPAMVKRKKRRSVFRLPSASVTQDSRTAVLKPVSECRIQPPFRVLAFHSGPFYADVHVILVDPEQLITQLLSSEVSNNTSPDTNATGLQVSQSVPNIGRAALVASKSNSTLNRAEELLLFPADQAGSAFEVQASQMLLDAAQFLLSCLHAWGLDPELDNVCISRLGLLKPQQPLCFGQLTWGRLCLSLPGWHCWEQEAGLEKPLESTNSKQDAGNARQLEFSSHWQFSSVLTTTHVLTAVSMSNTLMSMSSATFTKEKPSRSFSGGSGGGSVDYSADPGTQQTMMMWRSQIKAGWSQLAALHCCLLPDLLHQHHYRPPLLHLLARRWQDSCLEIRDAAQAILLAELRRIGPKGRRQIIDAWAPHLPQAADVVDVNPEDCEATPSFEEEKVISGSDELRESWNTVNYAKKLMAVDVRIRQATAIIMLGVILSEFQRELDPLNKKGDYLLDIQTVRNTATSLTTLLLQRSQKPPVSHSLLRRAAIDLIGRGFSLWEPHIDVSQVLVSLLELCSTTDLRGRGTEVTKGIPLTPATDLVRSSKHSLTLIATNKPSAFITTLSKEIARQMSSTAVNFNQPSPSGMSVYSHTRHLPAGVENQSISVIQLARHEILRIVEMMIEKAYSEVTDLIVEVVDVVVHCLDYKVLKEKGLAEAFPSLCRFPVISYCSQSRRLAVGSRAGYIALYEPRSSRYQAIPAHSGPITSLVFSPDGKTLSTYSFQDGKLSFWQASSSLLGILSSPMRCVQSFTVSQQQSGRVLSAVQAQKGTRLVWISNKSVVLLLGDNNEHKFSL